MHGHLNGKFYTNIIYGNKATCIVRRPYVQLNKGYSHSLELC